MKKDILYAVVLGLALPWFLLNFLLAREQEEQVVFSEPSESIAETIALTMYLRLSDGTVTETDMDTYLTGVILAELPASFEMEAKKAQAVVARTYTWKAVTTGGKHGDGSVCTESACCQAYIAPADYSGTEEAVAAAEEAVMATSGCVLTYEGALIEATYFSCSGGSTEDAVAVWGTDFPYLRATDSPGEENAAHYTDTVCFTAEQFRQALGVTLAGSPESWLGTATYTSGGGVDTIVIGGISYKGTELRSLLGLRSTAFVMSADDAGITVTTKGYGHRVGMSQYGADAMAAAGSGYAEILAHYYQGTALEILGEN